MKMSEKETRSYRDDKEPVAAHDIHLVEAEAESHVQEHVESKA